MKVEQIFSQPYRRTPRFSRTRESDAIRFRVYSLTAERPTVKLSSVSKQNSMPSHMSDIGFHLETDEAFQHLAFRAYEEGETFETREGAYVR